MDSASNKPQTPKPLGFGQTMLASAVGVIIAFVVLNVLTIIMALSMMSSALSAQSDVPVITGDNLAIELDLTQSVNERTPSQLSTLFGQGEGTSLEQLITAIENAALDDRVNALYLHLGGSNLSWAQAEELQLALARFNDVSAKPIIAWGESMTQPEYFLSTSADRIGLHPSGTVDFRGIGGEVIFYKGLLDKLGVHMELIRPTSCAYKSAGEVYTRTNMSDANREQVRSYISSIWDYALQVIAQNRDITPEHLNTYADNLTGHMPDQAVAAHLIDTLCFAQDIKQMLRSHFGATKIVKANKYAKACVAPKGKNIAIIYAEGDVVPGSGDGTRTAVYGDDVVKALNDATKDKSVHAIILRVNSPGGAVTASEAMTYAVRCAKEKKPVIVSMSGMAASAGYEISCFATKIVAHPTTLTGSIGVFATIPEVGTLLRQKLGITTDTVMTNRNSTGISALRPLSKDAREVMQRGVEDFYITFTQRVADGRGLSRTYVDSIARGRVWTGLQAKQIGLVDTLGGLSLAFELAAKEAKLNPKECRLKAFPAEKGLLDQLFEQVNSDKEEEIKARINAVIPFYSELCNWSTMEPLQARLPFIMNIE